MTPNENQIDVLINYNDNIDKVTKHIKDLDTQIKTMQSNISKASTNNYNQQKGLILAAQQKIKLLQSELTAETNNLNNLTKLRQDQFVKELKNTHDLSNSKTEANKKFKAESEAFAKWGANFNKQQLAEELAMYKTNQKLKTAEAAKTRAKEMADKRAEARTWKGAWFGSDAGSTFGHKFLTTTQYAAAGTALFGAASAITAMGKAALDADLNMRTMSAVLKLNISEATALDKSVRALGETYGGTTVEIEQVAIALGRAGIASKDITKATEITLAMARLTGDTFEQSASAVISYQQVFGNTTSIQMLGDKLAYVANVSRLSTQDIGTFSNYALAAAKDVGLTEDAVGGLAAAFSNAGVNASTIGTQIRRFTTLLTDDSEAVTNFYRSIGVNQKNLLAELQKGGVDSNKALLDFVNQLKSVDKVTFTQLTGQMDILAANSLQLMRNNSSNINKFVTDLQTGMVGQLDSTKVILDSYVVTFESMWNKLKNISADGLIGLQDDITQISRVFDIMWGERDKAALKGLKIEQDNDDKALAIWRENFSKKLITFEEMDKTEQYFMAKRIKRENTAKDLLKQNSKSVIKTKAEEIAEIDKMIANTDDVLFNEQSTKADIDIAKRRNDELIAKKKELVGVIKEEAKANIVVANSLSISDNVKSINTLMSAKKDYSKLEQLVNSQVSTNLKNNTALIAKQVDGLKDYPDMFNEINTVIKDSKTPYDLLTNASAKYEDVVSRINALQKDNGTGKNNTEINKLDKTKNSLLEIKAINENNIKDADVLLDLETKKNNLLEKDGRSAEARRKAEEAAAERIRKYEETKNQLLTSTSELKSQINQEEELTLSKAESKFRIDTQLVALAYDQYVLAKGTTGEKAAELTYLEAENKYFKSTLAFLTKQVELEEKRKSLSIELNSNLTQAIEGEQVRLGIIEKSTDSEYEKLRVKIEQGKLDDTLVGEELAQAERRLAELKVLQSRKKDIHTLAMEYQREIQDQETTGYMAAKAGLASLESGMMNFFDVTSDGWLDWHSLASGVLSSIYKQLLEQLLVKQLVSGIAGGISGAFSPTTSVGTNLGSTAGANNALLGIQGSSTMFNANGGSIPTKGYASGGILSGGTGIRDDIYLGNVSGTRVFAMGGEFITRKSSVNPETKSTLDYINKTGTTPSSNAQVNVPVKINIENNTGQNITADMIESITQPNGKGEYEKVVNIILKASQTDPRVRSMLKGR